MKWLSDFEHYFLGGAFLVIGFPYLIYGLSGRRFGMPFTFPKDKESSPLVSLVWGLLGLFVGFLLVTRERGGVTYFPGGRAAPIMLFGGLVMAAILLLPFRRLAKK